jgi:hypothetical protein
MKYAVTEAERARRLAGSTYDRRLARELTAYATELERALEDGMILDREIGWGSGPGPLFSNRL